MRCPSGFSEPLLQNGELNVSLLDEVLNAPALTDA
jgi:hypothetical protein